MKYLTAIFLVCVLSLSACGGGGGDGSEVPFFGGVWRGTIQLVSNSCPWQESQTLLVEHTVNQVDTRIVLNVPGRQTYEGFVEGTDGFRVGQDILHQDVGNGVFCDLDGVIIYDNIRNSTAEITFGFRFECNSGGEQFRCDVAYVGSATKS